jgi:two-component system response regulator FixJ
MMALGAEIPMLVLARSRQHLPAPKLIQFSALSAGGCHLQQPCFAPWQAKNTTMTGDRVVHVIDDDAAIRRALVRLLRSAGLHVLTYETAAAVLDAASDLSSGCMLLDLQMPGMDGIELLARLDKLGVGLPVIVVTGHGDVPTAVKAMKAGAVDFIEKPIDATLLLNAIDTALTVNEPAARDSEAARAAEMMALLSPRERQVLEAVAVGRPNKLIAYELGISVRTVEVHRAHMLDRLACAASPKRFALR